MECFNLMAQSKFVCFSLGVAARRVQRHYERALAPFGLTASQFLTLEVLWKENGLKFKELAECLSIEGPTFTGALDRLEQAGYVERRDDPDDRRSLRIWVTPRGQEIKPTAFEAARVLDERLRGAFSPEDFAVFARVLAALPGEVSALLAEPAPES